MNIPITFSMENVLMNSLKKKKKLEYHNYIIHLCDTYIKIEEMILQFNNYNLLNIKLYFSFSLFFFLKRTYGVYKQVRF